MPETLTLQEKIKALPTQPGVYLFKDKTGAIIYIGKAKVLRNRVRSYFHSADSKDFKTRKMVPKITDLDEIVDTAWQWFQSHPHGYADGPASAS